jgi:hypothetical protein
MKKLLLLLLTFVLSFNIVGQEKEKGRFFKNVYKELFKYSTIYVAGDMQNPKEEAKDYFVRTNPDGGLYDIPVVVDGTSYHEFDYRYGFGIRKLARYDYEVKGKQYYDGTENNVGLSATNSPVKGLEYVFHWEKERERDELYDNHRYFLKHSGKYHMVKVESRKQGKVDFNYKSAEVRAKLPIGKKFSISAGVIYRTHERPYGYNPVEIWLNETNEWGNAVNPWYTLGFEYGYDDHFVTVEYDGQTLYDWYWTDPDGNVIAHTDLEFRETVFTDLMNRYNEEIWAELDAFGVLSPIVGFDWYHYKNSFWIHMYGSYLPPYHKYIQGDENFSYLNRNNQGVDGPTIDGEEGYEQWEDYQAGIVFGWKLSKSIGVFFEGEYTKFWDSEIYNSSVGLNITLK